MAQRLQTRDFEAVVLAAGKGSRMMEMTAEKPKCLLPIGNCPMIFYPLQLLERAGFSSTLVVVSESAKNEITNALKELNLKIKLDFIGVSEDDLGTADCMRIVQEKIKKDCIVISSDLIANIDITPLLDLYQKNNASIAALMLPAPKITEDCVIAGPKSKEKPEIDLIGIEDKTDRFVFFASASDFEKNVFLSSKLAKKHSEFIIHSKLLDAHLYVINKWVLNFLAFNKSFSSLKGELLPYVIKKQLTKPPKPVAKDKNNSALGLDTKEDIHRFCSENENPLESLVREMSSFNDCNSSLEDPYHADMIRCYAYKISEQCGLRANTIKMYSLANATIDKLCNVGRSSISPDATVKCTQVQECRIDDNAFIDERTSLKQSNIGAKSTVETRTIIANSVLMDNVTIKQKCTITNSILCNGCVIEEGTTLKNCLVGAKFTVPSGGNHSDEILTDANELIST